MSAMKWPEPRLMVLLGALYFSQGLPFGLLTRALPAIARDAGMPLQYIGLLALAAVPWALKFLWAPWVDRLGCGRPGHRQRWILGTQLWAVAMLLLMGLMPMAALDMTLFLVLLLLLLFLNLAVATHDIASDGLAVRLLPSSLRGVGNSLQAGGYKVGLLAGGSLLLWLTGALGWQATLALTAAVLLLLLLPVLRFPEPAGAPADPVAGAGWRWWLAALWCFWRQPGMGWWLLVLLVYKVGDSFGTRMIKPFLVDLGWSLAQLAALDLMASLAGLLAIVLGGLLLRHVSRLHALVLFALLQGIAFAGWAWLANAPHGGWISVVAVLEQCADGLATVALFTVMMDRCRPLHEGSDYTLQASTVLMASGLFTLVSGFSATALGYSGHFALAATLALAAIIPVLCWGRAQGSRNESRQQY